MTDLLTGDADMFQATIAIGGVTETEHRAQNGD